MNSPSPYGPDLSLPLAIGLLIGGALFAAAVVYLLTTSAETLTAWHRNRLAETQARKRSRSVARRRTRHRAPANRLTRGTQGTRISPFFSGRVPIQTESESPTPSPESPTQGMYDLHADLSHADLGTRSDGPRLGMAGAGTGRAGGESPTGDLSDAGGASFTADLGIKPSSGQAGWRADASALRRQARALSGALAHLDRANRSSDETRRSGSNPASGNASTTTAAQGPRATADPPDPPPDPEQVPVDGGLGWLAAAGAAYAANRLRERNNLRKSDDEG